MSTTTNTGLNKPDYNSTVPTWDQPLNYNETILDSIFGNTTSVAMPTGATSTTTLTGPASSGSLGQTQSMRILLTGALSANQYLQIPTGIGGRWIVYNTCTGTSNVYITSGGGGTSVVAPQSYNVSIYSDGTNIRYTDDGLTNNFANLTVLGNTYLATQSGNVGIGTTSPGYTLDLQKNTTSLAQFYYTDGTYNPRLQITGSSSGITLNETYSTGASNFMFAIAGTEYMRINGSGNVGIGTSSPVSKLDVKVGANNGAISFGRTTTELEIFVANGNDQYLGGTVAGSVGVRSITGALFLGTASGQSLVLETNSTERARIDSSGNLLVGTTSANDNSGIGLKLLLPSSAYPEFAVVGSASTTANTGYTLYSTGVGAYRFYVTYDGVIHATSTSIAAISDATLKTNVKDLETGLTEVMALKPRRFDWINGDATNVAGFIAQEVEQVLPELVVDSLYSKDEEGNEVHKKNLKMGDILPTLVKAIQELNAEIQSLKAEVATLKGA